MELKSLKASFGRLNGAELRLHPGLNVIEAPNESGKSTWAAFLRAMLYGVSTSERARAGFLPDRQRYQPWSGAPMAGTAELRWQDRDITLRRVSPGGGKPMGLAEAVYTGTEEKVPELRAGVPGETLLGVSEAVYRRSAFIAGSELRLDANAELEKRILRLVTSGEERSSYTEADDRLRRWQRRRRWRSSGSLPEAELQRLDVQAKLRRIENDNKRLSELREQLAGLDERRALLENELALHRRDEQRALRERAAEAEASRVEAVREAEAAQQRLAGMEEAAQGLSEEKVRLLRAAAVRREEAARDRDAAAAAHDRAAAVVAALPPTETLPNPKKKATVILYILGVLVLLTGFVLFLPVVVAGLALLLIACLLSASGRSAARAEEEARRHERELAEQAETSAHSLLEACEAETADCEQAQTAALEALGASPGDDPEAAAQDAEALLHDLRDARLLADNAQTLAERLSAVPSEPVPPIPEDELTGVARMNKTDAEALLQRLEAQRRSVTSELNRGEGVFDLLGDPLVLATEEAGLTEKIARLQAEYDALELAADALREANTQLQTLFSPLISRRAAELMARMTDSAYTGVFFDREMRFSALRSGDLDAHALEYLSEGTRSQLYLAVRLAICELVLPGDDPCPLVLDDVLATFDDRRAKDTLRLLRELSKTRQILLFTCQGREARLLKELEKEDA